MHAIRYHQRLIDRLPHMEASLLLSFRRCVHKLSRHQWDGGCRVKRLKGVPFPIWEARTDAGNRVVFTLSPTVGGGATEVRIWDLLKHDDVPRVVRRMWPPDLQFLAELDDHAEIREVSADNQHELVAESLQAPADYLLHDLPENVLQPLTLNELSHLLRIKSRALENRLTAEQMEVAQAPGDLLLSGAAGSGKTTIGVHRLLRLLGRQPFGRFLFVAYNPDLVRYASELFDGGLRLAPSQAIAERVEFRTVFDLLADLLDLRQEELSASLVDFETFRKMRGIREHGSDLAVAWSEIRSIIKGANLEVQRPLLAQDPYLKLGQKRAPDLVNNRKSVYRLAERYQELLQNKGHVDEIDLVRRALQGLPARYNGQFTGIICDEAQDLTELHIRLLFQLLHPQGEFFLTGDINQIIQPSGFRWQEVRSAFRRQGRAMPAEAHLSHNFRSIHSIAEFARAVLAWRKRLLGGTDAEVAVVTAEAGDAPIHLCVDPTSFADHLAKLGGDSAILVPHEELQAKLRQDLNTPFVFTIDEAKGLEFDTVWVWDFFGAYRDLYERIVIRPEKVAKPALTNVLNRFYVAVTRARRQLVLLDPQQHLLAFPDLMHLTRPGAAGQSIPAARELTVDEWVDRGQYYEARGLLDAAIACFERGGAHTSLWQAKAEQARKAGKLRDAALALLSIPYKQGAAALFEQNGDWEDARQLYEASGEAEGVARCDANLLEKQGHYEEAFPIWLQLGKQERALACAQRSKDTRVVHLCQAEIKRLKGDGSGAAKHLQQIGNHLEAARLFEQAGELRLAASAYRTAGRRDEAVRLFPASPFASEVKPSINHVVPTSPARKSSRLQDDVTKAQADASAGNIDPRNNEEGWHAIDIARANSNQSPLTEPLAHSPVPTVGPENESEHETTIRSNEKHSPMFTQLLDLLHADIEDGFRALASIANARHSVDSFDEDITSWYKSSGAVLVDKAMAQKRSGDYDGALATYQKAYEQMPCWPNLYRSVFKVLVSAGRLEEARRAMELHAFMFGLEALRKPILVSPHAVSAPGPMGYLARVPSGNFDLCNHLGMVNLLIRKQTSSSKRQNYIDALSGRNNKDVTYDQFAIELGRDEVVKLPWHVLSDHNLQGKLIWSYINQNRSFL